MRSSTDDAPNPAPSCHSERSEESTPAQPCPAPRLKIIVGLGNPGPRYAATRHNVGFDCVNLLSKRWNIPLSDRRQHAVIGQGEVEGAPVVLAKPRTFMNNSGEAVKYLLARFRARPYDLVIIYDEMALPLGTIRLRPRGGTAGHQGMASIVNAIDGTDFPRIRVGIGKPESPDEWVSYVLDPFTPEEAETVQEAIQRTADAVASLLHKGIDRAMNTYNTTPSPLPPSPLRGED